jgi:hypothetical protein
MKYTYTKKTKTNWISYILEITGWETDFGEVFSEIHFTMPKTFDSESNMANCPHITITTKSDWILHRYEIVAGKKARKYSDEKRRLVKKGTQSYVGDVIPSTSNEKLIIGYIEADLGTMKRP